MDKFKLLFDRAYYYYQLENINFKNEKMNDFIKNLKKAVNYSEEKLQLPLKVCEGSVLIYFSKDGKELVGDGIVVCDAILFDPENYTYTKIFSNLGIRETFNYNNVSVSYFLMDGNMALQFKESAKIDIGQSAASFLYIHSYNDENLVHVEEEEMTKIVESFKDDYKKILKISQGDYSEIEDF